MSSREPDLNDEDDRSSREGSAGQGDEDKGKSSAVRKAQNRIAQREFRLRKQQYIRDLEAKVEVLSGDKEERVELMTLLIRNLLKENKDLRSMVKSMAAFVGEGLGSCLPRLGLSAPQLDAILNRADTDTAHDAFLALKASREMERANPGIAIGEIRRRASAATAKRKRQSMDPSSSHDPTDGTPASATPDAAHGSGSSTHHDDHKRPKVEPTPPSSDQYAYLFPDLDALASTAGSSSRAGYVEAPAQSPNFPAPFGVFGMRVVPNALGNWYEYPGAVRPDQAAAGMSQVNGQYPPSDFSGFGLTGEATSTAYPPNPSPATTIQPRPPPPQQQQPYPSGPSSQYPTQPPPAAPSGNADLERARRLKMAVAHLANSDRGVSDGPDISLEELEKDRQAQEAVMESWPVGGEMTRRNLEALQVLSYHLNNFRLNHAYHLPPSLTPTVVQRTIPHEHSIDGIIFPSMRDRMIMFRGRYDLVEAFYGIISEWSQHGNDALDHRNWEVSEKWINEFSILVDDEVVRVTNQWRATRGERPLVMPSSRKGMGGSFPPPPVVQETAQNGTNGR